MRNPLLQDRPTLLATLDRARADLANATNEPQRADAITRESRAALELDALSSHKSALHPAVRAAMVRVGSLTEIAAIDSLGDLLDSSLSHHFDELVAVLSGDAWQALTQRFPQAKTHTWRWMYAALERGALDECFDVLSREATINATFVARVCDRFGRDRAAQFAPLVRAALSTVGDDDGDDNGVDDTSLLLALPPEEVRPRVLELARTIEQLPTNQLFFDEDYEQRDPRSTLVLVLCAVGEIQRALELFARIVKDPIPWAREGEPPVVTPGLQRSLQALSSALTAEERALVHQSVHERFVPSTLTPNTLAALSELLIEPFATRYARALVDTIERTPAESLFTFTKHPVARPALVAQKRSALELACARDAFESRERYALSSALQSLSSDDEDDVRFVVDRVDAIENAIRGDKLARFSTTQWLLRSAQRGSSLAQEALRDQAERGVKIWQFPRFYEGLSDDLVRAVIEHAPAVANLAQHRRDAIRLRTSFLEGASADERARWWPALAARLDETPSVEALLECAHVIPSSAYGAVIDAFVPAVFRTVHDALALTRTWTDPAATREVVERALVHFADRAPQTKADWLNAQLSAIASDPCAMQWLARCYGEDAISKAALPPPRVRAYLEGVDLYANDAWLREVPSRLLVDALRATNASRADPLIKRCADACWTLWIRDGARTESAAWFSLRDLAPHASIDTTCAMAEHPWTLESEAIAHQIALRIDALRRATPSQPSLLLSAARALQDRFELVTNDRTDDGSAWFRAVRRWVSEDEPRAFDAVFRPIASDWRDRDLFGDLAALGLVDEAFALGDELPPSDAIVLLETLATDVSDDAFVRALPWIRRAIDADPQRTLASLDARARAIPVELVVMHWVTSASRMWPTTIFTRPHALRALVGDAAFARIGELLFDPAR